MDFSIVKKYNLASLERRGAIAHILPGKRIVKAFVLGNMVSVSWLDNGCVLSEKRIETRITEMTLLGSFSDGVCHVFDMTSLNNKKMTDPWPTRLSRMEDVISFGSDDLKKMIIVAKKKDSGLLTLFKEHDGMFIVREVGSKTVNLCVTGE